MAIGEVTSFEVAADEPAGDMNPDREYLRFLRPKIPAAAFASNPRKLFFLAGHVAILVAGELIIRWTDSVAIWVAVAMLSGHSVASIAFFAHELSHGAVVRQRSLRYPLEVLAWGVFMTPATMWRRTHNHAHHLNANTVIDTDRQFRQSEERWDTRLFSRLAQPHRGGVRVNPLVWLGSMLYGVRMTTAVFWPQSWLLPSVVSRATYTLQERRAVLFEMGVIAAIQLGVFAMVGGDWWRYAVLSTVTALVASATLTAYTVTNHFLNPLVVTRDSLAASTSVTVPKLVDSLHLNFSYHTEHHLFPGLNSDYYPLVGRLVRKHYGDRYHTLPLVTAWQKLWQGERTIVEPIAELTRNS
ncbi:MAG: fatty acid desaturase [Planctomycetia bacterium]|nr:fatty acid desaturase [Planctomycetia bacterium]